MTPSSSSMQMFKKTNILIIGTIPSTSGIGGVTIHVSRLCDALSNLGENFKLCDYKKLPLFHQIKMIRTCHVVHLHVSNPYLRLFYVLLSKTFSKKVILTFHGNLGRFGVLKNYIDLSVLRLCDVPVMINEGSFQKAKTYNPKAVLISAYIPSAEHQELSVDIMSIVESVRNTGKTMVVTNASYMQFAKTGEEVYGIHFLVNYFKDRPDYHLLVSDPSGQYYRHYEGACPDNVNFITKEHSFAALVKHADLMIRATSTDGDSLSVREALDSGVRVLATDCVDRPEGVTLFKYNDVVSLSDALRFKYVYAENHTCSDDVIGSIVKLYYEMLNGR